MRINILSSFYCYLSIMVKKSWFCFFHNFPPTWNLFDHLEPLLLEKEWESLRLCYYSCPISFLKWVRTHVYKFSATPCSFFLAFYNSLPFLFVLIIEPLIFTIEGNTSLVLYASENHPCDMSLAQRDYQVYVFKQWLFLILSWKPFSWTKYIGLRMMLFFF